MYRQAGQTDKGEAVTIDLFAFVVKHLDTSLVPSCKELLYFFDFLLTQKGKKFILYIANNNTERNKLIGFDFSYKPQNIKGHYAIGRCCSAVWLIEEKEFGV